MSMAVSKQWTRVRTLGRGASGAEVFLATDDASGDLFAVKSAPSSGAAALRREERAMAGLRSPHLVSCIGGRTGRDGSSYHLFLEFAPGGSLAEEVAKSGGGLDEPTVRAYAADVAAGLAYLHGEGTVHGDVKARNVVIGADGRAKLADFGCARKECDGGKIIGGTPAFMAPEVARGEEQGPAADVWALGCTVVEMATGRAPWSGMDGDALAAMHRIGYSNAVPEVPQWLSAEAKDFLARCLIRQPTERCTAAQLLEHPFLVSAVNCVAKRKWVSPKSTLDAPFWESESETEEADDDELSTRTADRIKALACPASALPDWDSDEGWIDVLSAPTDAVAVPAEESIDLDEAITSEEEPCGVEAAVDTFEYRSVLNGVDCDSVVWQDRDRCLEISVHPCKIVGVQLCNGRINARIDFVVAQSNSTSASQCSSSSLFLGSTLLCFSVFYCSSV